MSAYTTLYISRSKAIDTLQRWLEGNISNHFLEHLMDIYLDYRLYNCIIVPGECAENDNAAL